MIRSTVTGCAHQLRRRGSERAASHVSAAARVALVVGLTLVAGLVACGDSGGGSIDVSVAPVEFAQAGWETEFSDDEARAWHTGEILSVPVGTLPELSTLDRIPGAKVDLLIAQPSGLPPFRLLDSAETDAEGRYRVGPAPEGPWLIRVTKEGYAVGFGGNTPRIFGSMQLPEGDAQFGIRPAMDVAVQVVDEAGKALVGTAVRAQTMAYQEEAHTDADGLAAFRAPVGPIEFVVIDAERWGAKASGNVRVSESGPPQVFELSAPLLAPLTGWVHDALTGQPLAGAVVLVVERPEIWTTTDAHGAYELLVPRLGAVAAFGRGRGWSAAAIPSVGELELRLGEADVVRGRVVAADGSPVVGARVMAAAPRADGVVEGVLGPVTGSDGRFVFDWCPRPPRGQEASVVVAAVRRGESFSSGVRVETGPLEVTLELPGVRRIDGVVQRSSGAATPHPAVVFEFEPEGMTLHEAAAMGLSWTQAIRGSADGSFALPFVPAVKGQIIYRFDGGRFERRVESTVDTRADLILDAGLAIAGRVVDVHGEPITTGGVVRVSALNHPEFSDLRRDGPLEDDGTFRIDDLPPGTYGLSASAPTYDVGGAVVDAGATGIELVGERPASLAIELTFPEGAERVPVLVQLINAVDPLERPRKVLIEPSGDGASGLIELVRRGQYHVLARGGAFRANIRDVELADGIRPPLEVALERTLVRTLRLADRDGAPLSGRKVRVTSVSERGRPLETFWTGERGEAEISGLSEGEWSARVVEPGKPIAETRFTVGSNDGDDVVLEYPPHGTLIVRVDGERAEGGVVALSTPEGAAIYGWVEGVSEISARFRVPEDGDLVIRGIPAGDVEVVVRAGATETGRRTIRVEDGGEATVRVP